MLSGYCQTDTIIDDNRVRLTIVFDYRCGLPSNVAIKLPRL